MNLPLDARYEVVAHLPSREWMTWKDILQPFNLQRLLTLSQRDVNEVYTSAILANDGELVTLLLQHPEVNPNYKSSSIWHQVINKNLLSSASILFKDTRVQLHGYIVTIVCQFGSLDMVRLLFELRPEVVTKEGNMPMQLACHRGDPSIVKYLLDDGHIDPSANNSNCLLSPCLEGYVEVVTHLLNDPRVKVHEMALLNATIGGNETIVRMLIEKGVDPSLGNNSALSTACIYGHESIVKFLLQDPRVKPRDTCIIRVAEKGYTSILRLLLEDGRVDPGINKNEAIKVAIENGYQDIVDILSYHPRVMELGW